MQSAMFAAVSAAVSEPICDWWPPAAQNRETAVCQTAGLVAGLDSDGCSDLRGFLADLTDPRGRRGRRYGYVALVAIAAAAMLGGANSVAAIARWAGTRHRRSWRRWGWPRMPAPDGCALRA